MKKKKLYTVYKITNNINNKIYVGVHQTTDINDDYMGSGGGIIRSIQKYGVDNFTKETLFIFDNLDDMFNKEKEIVNETFVNRTDTYNKIEGGKRGLDYINERGLNIYPTHLERSKENLKGGVLIFLDKLQNKDFKNQWRAKLSSTHKQMFIDGKENSFKNKKHKPESKRKIGRANAIHQAKEGNSQYSTKWIYSLDLKLCRKIHKDDNIPNGWNGGRIMNFDLYAKKQIIRQQKVNRKRIEKKKRPSYGLKKRIAISRNDALKLYEIFKHSGLSLRKFCRSGHYEKSHVSLCILFKKYIKNY